MFVSEVMDCQWLKYVVIIKNIPFLTSCKVSCVRAPLWHHKQPDRRVKAGQGDIIPCRLTWILWTAHCWQLPGVYLRTLEIKKNRSRIKESLFRFFSSHTPIIELRDILCYRMFSWLCVWHSVWVCSRFLEREREIINHRIKQIERACAPFRGWKRKLCSVWLLMAAPTVAVVGYLLAERKEWERRGPASVSCCLCQSEQVHACIIL